MSLPGVTSDPVFSRFFALLGIILVIPICIGLLLLQVYLSRRKSRWPGLALPVLGISGTLWLLIISLISTERIFAANTVTLLNLIACVLLGSYTVLLNVLYIVGRHKSKQPEQPYVGTQDKIELKKMDIQDL